MNNLFNVWQSVLVADAEHERNGHAGTVHKAAPLGAETVDVRFDSDGQVLTLPVASVRVL